MRLAGRAGQDFVGGSTVKVDNVWESGFLSDYSMLTPGPESEASAEDEVRDAQTGELLAVGVDRWAGTKSLGRGVIHSWGDAVNAIFDWAEQFSRILRKRQGR